jgi:hypothetical protein
MVEDVARSRAALLTLRLVLASASDRESSEAPVQGLAGEPLEECATPHGVVFVFPELVCGVLERGGDGRADQVWTERCVGELVDARLYDRAGRLVFRAWWSAEVTVPAEIARRILRLQPVGVPALN